MLIPHAHPWPPSESNKQLADCFEEIMIFHMHFVCIKTHFQHVNQHKHKFLMQKSYGANVGWCSHLHRKNKGTKMDNLLQVCKQVVMSLFTSCNEFVHKL